MTAFQTMMLSGHGAPEMPECCSDDMRLKSRIRRRRLAVDYRGVRARVSDRQAASGLSSD